MPSGVFDRLEQAADAIIDKLDEVTSALKKFGDGGGARPSSGKPAPGGGGGGVGGLALPGAGGRGAAAGGRAGALRGLVGKVVKRTAVGAAIATAGLAAKVGADALVQSSRGGDFGASAAASLNRVAARLGPIGELGGFAPLNRVTQGVQGDLDSVTNQIARYGGEGAIQPEVRKILAEEFSRQNRNVELDRQKNQAASEAVLVQSARGLGAGAEGIASIGTSINSFLTAIGINQHQ